MSELQPGQLVTICGLKSHPQLNGQQGEVVGPDPKKPERVEVKVLSSGQVLSFAFEKLRADTGGGGSAATASDHGQMVMFRPRQLVAIRGIQSKPSLNDQQAEVVGPDPKQPERVEVKLLGSGEVVSLKLEKLCVITGSGGSAAAASQPSGSLQPGQPGQAGVPPPSPPHSQPRMDRFQRWLEAALGGQQSGEEKTVVMLGQTGSGKTSFLNLLSNFPIVIQHGQEAIDGKVMSFHDVKFENDLADKTASKTSEATVYMVPFGGVLLKIIDTPGYGDTRGRQFDEQHAKKIVDAIKGQEHIHAITLVISGRESRMTPQLKYVLTEICAILPRGARSNLITVFTNTANPLYLSFEIDDLSKLVEHAVSPDRQIFIENPYVLWERSAKNQGKGLDSEMQKGLVQAFEAAGANMEKFYKAITTMPRLNTKDFERMYTLRKDIEASTIQVLAEMENLSEQKKKLEAEKRQIALVGNEMEMNKAFSKKFKAKRWVFKDAPAHGTFCSVKGCHSNCHAPCIMEKTCDNEKFKKCSAFYYTEQDVTLDSEADRSELLRCMSDKTINFHTDQDGGEGTNNATILIATNQFTFKGKSFITGAFVAHSTQKTSIGFSAKSHIQGLDLPTTVKISDTSDQDTCKKCGHHRSFHYHDNKKWEEELYEEEVVDSDTKKKFLDAKGLYQQKEEVMKGIQKRIGACEEKQEQTATLLLQNIRQFEEHGLTRNYALLLQNQLDLLDQHIDATVDGENGVDVKGLKRARAGVSQQLDAVKASMKKNPKNEVEWAQTMLTLSKNATLQQVEAAYKKHSKRLHPDKFDGSPERMQQINEAVEIMRKHLPPKKDWFGWLR